MIAPGGAEERRNNIQKSVNSNLEAYDHKYTIDNASF